MGTDAEGRFVRFYDNGTKDISKATSKSNKLYFNDKGLSGYTAARYAGGEMRLTQIRKTHEN